MAHSLFEPAPVPFGEKIWRRVKDLSTGLAARPAQPGSPAEGSAPDVLRQQVLALDARGRQQFLKAQLQSKPIAR
ncbi:hypothetical protein [Roseibium sp.]|uniref:hypothetical protein n=1 Tax=Roseibium sp. TaxID=1936156 RepID=UPI003D12A3C4